MSPPRSPVSLKSCNVTLPAGTFRDGVGVMVLHEVAKNTSAQRSEAAIFVFIIQSVLLAAATTAGFQARVKGL
jgi:hypothetical protein